MGTKDENRTTVLFILLKCNIFLHKFSNKINFITVWKTSLKGIFAIMSFFFFDVFALKLFCNMLSICIVDYQFKAYISTKKVLLWYCIKLVLGIICLLGIHWSIASCIHLICLFLFRNID